MANVERVRLESARDQLSKIVAETWSASEAGESERVDTLFSLWLADQVVNEVLNGQLEQVSAELQEFVQLIAVGMAGLARNQHVDANRYLDQPDLQERSLARINQARLLRVRTQPAQLVPWTIHQGSINWLAEFAQDEAVTFNKTGQPEVARQLLLETLAYLGDTTRQLLAQYPDLTIEHPDRHQNPEKYRARKLLIGSLSARSVIYRRLAEAAQSQTLATESLTGQLELSRIAPDEFNEGRLKSLTRFGLVAARQYPHHGTSRRQLLIACAQAVQTLGKHRLTRMLSRVTR